MKLAHLLCCGFIVLGLIIVTTREAVAGSITLSIGSDTITFPSSSPSTSTSIAANENPTAVSLNYSGAGTWVITMIASSDLTGSDGSIPISSVDFTGTGVTNASGTLSTTSQTTIGSGGFTAQTEDGTLSFFFNNSWNYPAGSYSTSVVITAMSL
jgi:hypothetical protein